MPSKRGKKRKVIDTNTAENGVVPLAAPDRAVWPGWVEMESEPAFFNVMLEEMGVRGVKVREVYELDDQMLAVLPQPVHALIFLFRYRSKDGEQHQSSYCPGHIWFANQTPDFACATFALLNIVNNIPGLDLGRELGKFRDFTKDMDPVHRGDAIDHFDFVKRIHNSFARENDLLNADMYLRNKMNALKKRQAAAKARQTREAKKASVASNTPLKDISTSAAPIAARASPRGKRSSKLTEDDVEADGNVKLSGKGVRLQPHLVQEDDPALRRSGRTPKPRQSVKLTSEAEEEEEDEGFHFVAYMPIAGHVWKLDGMDRFPQDLGSYMHDKSIDNGVIAEAKTRPHGGEDTGWLQVATPALRKQIEGYAESEIQFNLMAVVHDSSVETRKKLIEKAAALQAVEQKLDNAWPKWRSAPTAEGKDNSTTDILNKPGIDPCAMPKTTDGPTTLENKIEEENLRKLEDVRTELLAQQRILQATLCDLSHSEKADGDSARHRRHDYSTFVREWLGALAEREMLAELMEN